MAELVTPISVDELESYKSWVLPDVTSNKIISAEKSQSKGARKDSSKRAKTGDKELATKPVDKTKKLPTEEVEDIVVDGKVEPLTAEQLQVMAETAEKEGYDNGYEKGYAAAKAEGYQSGYDEAKQTLAESAKHLQEITGALLTPLEDEQQQLEQALLGIVCQLTEALVQRELQIDSSSICELVKKALLLLPDTRKSLTLYLHSQDIDVVKEALGNEAQSAIYHIDDSLLVGGCRLESEATTVDLTVEHRLQQLLDDFLHKRHVINNELTGINALDDGDQESNEDEGSKAESVEKNQSIEDSDSGEGIPSSDNSTDRVSGEGHSEALTDSPPPLNKDTESD